MYTAKHELMQTALLNYEIQVDSFTYPGCEMMVNFCIVLWERFQLHTIPVNQKEKKCPGI